MEKESRKVIQKRQGSVKKKQPEEVDFHLWLRGKNGIRFTFCSFGLLFSTPESLTRKTQVERLNSIKGLFTHESLTDKTQSRRLISVKGPFTSESRTGKNTS